MAERITPEKGLDLKTTRKPMDWSECAVLLNPTKGQEGYLKGLSLFPCGDDHSPMTDLVKPAADGYLIRMPQRFLAKHKGAYYYVNTEGYSYCRYGLRVPASLFDANEPVQELAPAPIFEDKTEPTITESLQLEAYKRISGEKDAKTKNLVLAAKVMVGWLELHDYPAKTKALAKALQDAIDEA
jgi:hypothetical protein